MGKDGSCAQYGMVAVCDIPQGETLFQTPRPMLLSPQTSAIADLLNTGEYHNVWLTDEYR